jgi:hypothetical protein
MTAAAGATLDLFIQKRTESDMRKAKEKGV